jgi:hypothetical protein
MRFSLSTLIAGIVLVSVYFAALRQSSTLWSQTAVTLTVVLLTLGLLWLWCRPGADHAFWTGFELAGWGYLLLAFSSWSQAQLGAHLLTTRLAGSLHAQMPTTYAEHVMVEWHGTWFPAEVLSRDGSRHFIHYSGYGPEWDEWVGPARLRGQFGLFLQIYHSLLSLIMALAGGVLSVVLRTTGRFWLWFWIPWSLCAAGLVVAGPVGIVSNSDLAASSCLSLFLALLFLATLAAWSARIPGRASMLGFAIVGWAYFLLHFAPGLESSVGPHLLSTRGLNQLQGWLHPATVAPSVGSYYDYRLVNAGWTNLGVLYPSSPVAAGALAGHALLGAMLAALGGLIAIKFSRRAA